MNETPSSFSASESVQPAAGGEDAGSGAGSNWKAIIARSREVRWGELIALLLLVILSDFTLYQSQGYAGPAVLLGIAPVLIACGAICRCWNWQTAIVLLMIWGAVARLYWCGNWLALACGLVLLGGFSLSLAGGSVYLLELCRFLGGLVFSSFCGLLVYEKWIRQAVGRWGRIPSLARWLQFLLPPFVGLIFTAIFILANPDVVKWMLDELTVFIPWFREWVKSVIDSPWRVLFWVASLMVSIGLLRPLLMSVPEMQETGETPASPSADNPLLPAFRNSLLLLIVLFAAYLCFEFWTMCTRKFPLNFYYAGYAHQGAFWLTVALGLATVLLSLFFRGTIWADPRLPRLRLLAIVWSLENLLLAAAVYNRLFIYIDFNGMTRMRVIGMLGTSTVVVGLMLVVLKILWQRNFAWVVRHQLIALAVTVYLYAVLPIDAFVMAYDTRQVMHGNLKPSVQIAHHPTSVEGRLMLFPLLNCSDPIIQAGIRQMLMETRTELIRQRTGHWTSRQVAADWFFEIAGRHGMDESSTFPPQDSWERFWAYSFQWY